MGLGGAMTPLLVGQRHVWFPANVSKTGRIMNDRVEPVDVDEPAELSFNEKKGQGSLIAMDMIRFDRLSDALIYAVEKMHDSHRPGCMVTTRAGNIYRWGEITSLYEHIKIAT